MGIAKFFFLKSLLECLVTILYAEECSKLNFKIKTLRKYQMIPNIRTSSPLFTLIILFLCDFTY